MLSGGITTVLDLLTGLFGARANARVPTRRAGKHACTGTGPIGASPSVNVYTSVFTQAGRDRANRHLHALCSMVLGAVYSDPGAPLGLLGWLLWVFGTPQDTC